MEQGPAPRVFCIFNLGYALCRPRCSFCFGTLCPRMNGPMQGDLAVVNVYLDLLRIQLRGPP